MDARLPLSVMLLALDETDLLARLIPALDFAGEIVVVWDPRGDAATRAAAERLGARVFERPLDGFGLQRRFALAQCREPWVLWVDADERLDERAVADLRRVLTVEPAPAEGYTIVRRTTFLGRRIRFCGWSTQRLLRLFRRDRVAFDDVLVHEWARVDGRVERLAGSLAHDSHPSWAVSLRKLSAYAHAGAQQAWRNGRRAGPLGVLVRPPLRFLRMYVLQLGVLDGFHGFLVCALGAWSVFLKYAELWSMGRGRPGAPPR